MLIKGFKQILKDYDLFVVDVWGVVYDESKDPFPGVVPLLQEIHDQGKSLVFLSNTPHLKESLQTKLDNLRIPRNLYKGIYTSGMETNEMFLSGEFSNLGQKCFFAYGTSELLSGSDSFQPVDSIDDADFVLMAGIPERYNLNFYKPFLDQMLKKGITMICPNPDLFVVITSRKKLFCQGSVAQMYEELGGKVLYIGKPYENVYKRILSHHTNVSQNRIMVVGDNPATDIKGGNNNGLDSTFIINGMYADILYNQDGSINTKSIDSLCTQFKTSPTYICEWFAL